MTTKLFDIRYDKTELPAVTLSVEEIPGVPLHIDVTVRGEVDKVEHYGEDEKFAVLAQAIRRLYFVVECEERRRMKSLYPKLWELKPPLYPSE